MRCPHGQSSFAIPAVSTDSLDFDRLNLRQLRLNLRQLRLNLRQLRLNLRQLRLNLRQLRLNLRQPRLNQPDAAWFYPDPKAEARHIAGYVAFWRGVTVSE